jgi:peptide/nickel transport system ATP-binding protein
LTPLLRIEGLEVDFVREGRVVSHALRGIELQLAAGAALGVVGETGCGKTLTGLSILRMLPATARARGKVFFDGRDVFELDEPQLAELRGREISMVFQSPGTSFNPVFTIGDQLQQVARRHLGGTRKEAAASVAQALADVELPAPERTMGFYPHELSGGMLQRAMIAMAILCSPRLLIADEPTTALDVTLAEQILRLLRSLQDERSFAVFFISHDLELVGDFCDEVAVLYAGRVVEHGPAAELLVRPQHPYTRALLDSLPKNAAAGTMLPTVTGGVPTGLVDPPGCAFAPRCPLAASICTEERPLLTATGPSRRVACHRWELAA